MCSYSVKYSSKRLDCFFQSGGECLRAYVSVGPDQICHFTDAEGKSGLWYMVQVAGHLLNPVGSEFSATFVGRLVTTLIQVSHSIVNSEFEFQVVYQNQGQI